MDISGSWLLPHELVVLIETPEKLARALGVTIKDEGLLTEALSHRSLGKGNYERLEFLGDAVLNLVISEALYARYADIDEGTLSRMRASLVNGQMLAEIARERSLGDFIRLGEGELKSGGFRRQSILADIVESLIGAVFIEQGFYPCRSFVLSLFGDRLETLPTDLANLKDAKSRLQELLQSMSLPIPEYTLLETSGKPHEQEFTVECRIGVVELSSTARAGSRRKAEQAAATNLLNDPALSLENLKRAMKQKKGPAHE